MFLKMIPEILDVLYLDCILRMGKRKEVTSGYCGTWPGSVLQKQNLLGYVGTFLKVHHCLVL